jgi:predicted DNA-binding transcriptional regulator AlpA
MTTTKPQLVTAAEAARLLGVSRQRVLELAAAAADFPPAERTPTGGRVWPRAVVQAWAATHPGQGPVFTGPDIPPDGGHPPQIWAVLNRATSEAHELNHPWIDDDHQVLGMLHPDCPGAARTVLESFGIRLEPLRQGFIASMGDPWDAKPTHLNFSPATQLVLEGANLEAARLADAEVATEHVLLALISRGYFPRGWVARSGITAEAVRQRVVDATEGAALPEPPEQLEPPLPSEPNPEDALDLAPNPLGHDPRRRRPWGSRGFGVPLDRPPREGMLGRQYFIDRDGCPVLTTDGQPVHIVVDEDTMPVLDEHGHEMLGPVEIPEGATIAARPHHPDPRHPGQ